MTPKIACNVFQMLCSSTDICAGREHFPQPIRARLLYALFISFILDNRHTWYTCYYTIPAHIFQSCFSRAEDFLQGLSLIPLLEQGGEERGQCARFDVL